jgi:Zn-dependent membrane protease YugP
MHCMTVSLALDGAGLGAAWGEQTARSMLSDAGFTDVATERVEGDVFNVYYVARKA